MSFRSILLSSMRAAIWRKFRASTNDPHPLTIIALALLGSGAAVLFEWSLSGENSSFQLYGVNSALLMSVVNIAFVSVLAPVNRRSAAIATMLGLWILADLVLAGLVFGSGKAFAQAELPLPPGGMAALIIVTVVWSIGALAAVFRSLGLEPPKRPLTRSAGVVFGTMLTIFLLPNWPTFAGKDFSRSTANIWEVISTKTAASDPDPDWVEQQERASAIEMAQPALIERALAGLAPRLDGQSSLFTLGIAGSNSESVFATEIQASLDVLAQRFATKDRSILLGNSVTTSSTTPVASISNLSAVLGAIGRRMDADRDALVLVVTSHGNGTGVALEFGSVVRRMLTPATLKSMLDAAGIKNRIIVVSACYSGVFVPVLADDNTVVVTAASASTSSFGCSNDRDWTYFGDAFFNQALRTAPTVSAAFDVAKGLISAWEQRDGLTPSQPQIHIGEAISRHQPWVGAATEKRPEATAASLRD